jgi:hypothetical protein
MNEYTLETNLMNAMFVKGNLDIHATLCAIKDYTLERSLLNVMFVRNDFRIQVVVITTKRGICCVTLAAEKLLGCRNCKNILLRIKTLENTFATNVIKNSFG